MLEVAERDRTLHERVYLVSDGTFSNATRKGAVHAMKLACDEAQKLWESPLQGACIVAGDTLLRFESVFGKDAFDIVPFVELARRTDTDALLAYKIADEELSQRGILEVDSENRVIHFLEKPASSETSSRLACPPLYMFSKSTISEIGVFLEASADWPLDSRDPPGAFLQWLIKCRRDGGHLLTRPLYTTLINRRFDIGNLDQYKEAYSIFGMTEMAMQAPQKPVVGIGRGLARVGMIGNPSDGYNGKTVSFTISNFHAEVIIRASESGTTGVRFHETSFYANLESLSSLGETEGYSGGLSLLKATTKKFFDLSQHSDLSEGSKLRLSGRNFDMFFSSVLFLFTGSQPVASLSQ